MTNLTKRAITESFIRLIGEKPLDKITVKDIVEDCGITRNTFYYHYQDIYELLHEILEHETEPLMAEFCDEGAWEEIFVRAAHFLLENRRAAAHIFHSNRRQEVEVYVDRLSKLVMEGFVRHQAGTIPAQEEDVCLIAAFYRYAMAGILREWFNGGMKDEPEQMIRRAARLFEGNIETALHRSAGMDAPVRPQSE